MSEIGGDFYWPGLPLGECLPWPEPHTFFSTCRAVVVSVARQIRRQRLWLPVYFCPHTSQYWRDSGIELIRYNDNPMRSQPDWSTLNPNPGDMVLALNYFGVRTANPWLNWKRAYPEATLLEDHTHDPLSAWAGNSTADYAFASLRKTLPTPDGAIVWSPTGDLLPSEPTGQDWAGSALKLAGMIWKMEYINGNESVPALKEAFRKFQIEGEKNLDLVPDQQITPWSRALLQEGFPSTWRLQRENNVRQILESFPRTECISPLFETWTQGCCPFNVILIADSIAQRDALRKHLIDARIYPSIHWELPEETKGEARDISQRILTIPVDHRCTARDQARIIHELNDYLVSRM